MTLIIAHAGCDGTQPGSLCNLQAAVQHGADYIEFDLRYFDGRVLLSHNPIEAERLSAYMTLDDALAHLQATPLLFNCDLKEPTAFLPALRCFQARGMDARAVFTGCYPLDYDDSAAQHRAFVNLEHIPGVPQSGTLTGAALRSAAEWFSAARAAHASLAGINADYAALDSTGIRLLRALHIPVMCWTVDEPDAIAALLQADVYAITTNHVRATTGLRQVLCAAP